MRTTVLEARVQSLLEVTFLLNLFCSNTILAELAELFKRKPRLSVPEFVITSASEILLNFDFNSNINLHVNVTYHESDATF